MFYGHQKTIAEIREIQSKHPVQAEFKIFEEWDDFLILSRDLKSDDGLIIILSREKKLSYQNNMKNIPNYLNKYFSNTSFILVYPMQTGVTDEGVDLNNPSLIEPMEKIDEIGKTIAKLFRRK